MKYFWLLFFICPLHLVAQTDTIKITAQNVNTKKLIPGTHRYLVYSKNGPDSSRVQYQMWTRKIDFITYEGKDAIEVTQNWESNDTVIHTVYSVCDKKTFAPLYQRSWSAATGISIFDFSKRSASLRDTVLTDADTSIRKKRVWDAFRSALDQYVLNWHLDLEVFPLLPYSNNVTFLINFYDPGFPAPKFQSYTVAGSGKLKGYDGQDIDCWLLTHEFPPAGKATFWISKRTQEVLQLEQTFSGRYRYKIKLPFSN